MKNIDKIIDHIDGINEYRFTKEISNFHDSELIKISDLNNHAIYIPKISIIEIAKDLLE